MDQIKIKMVTTMAAFVVELGMPPREAFVNAMATFLVEGDLKTWRACLQILQAEMFEETERPLIANILATMAEASDILQADIRLLSDRHRVLVGQGIAGVE